MKGKNTNIKSSKHSHYQFSVLQSKSFLSEISNVNISNIEEEQITNQQESQSNHLTDHNNIHTGKRITFQIENTQHVFSIDIRIAISGYPHIISNINIDSEQVTLPDWIDIKTLKDYFTYIHLSIDAASATDSNSKLLLNQQFNFKKLVQLANYFENNIILEQMIQSNIIPNISIDNCISLINDAYQYCKQLSNEELKKHWAFLLIHLKKFIIKRFPDILQCFSKLKTLDNAILRDIVESYLLNNIKSNIEEISISQLLNVLYYLKDVVSYESEDKNSSERLFDLINKERKTIEEDLNQNDLKGNYISYMVDLSDFLNQYAYKGYKGIIELKRVYNKQEIIFTLTYNHEEDEVIVGMKVNKCSNFYKLLSVSARVLIQKDKASSKRVIRIISSNAKNNNNATVLMKISSFAKYINRLSDDLNDNNNSDNEVNDISLSITIKINIIETFILQYFIDNFIQLHKNSSIIRIPSSIVRPLMKIASEDIIISDESILSFIMLWLIDNSNIKDEDVINILEQINWEKIPLGKIFEFILKFPQFLSRHSIERSLISSIINKTNRKFKHNANANVNANANDLSGCRLNEKESSFKNGIKQDSLASSLQLNIITYFFVNLVECSKRIKYVQTLINLETLVNQLKNSAMVLSTAANNKSNNCISTSTSQFIKNKTHLPPTQSASILSQSIKINACDIDKKIPVITDNELAPNNKESKQSDSKSDNNKKSTESTNQFPNKSFDAYHSQGSGSLKLLYQTPKNKKLISLYKNDSQLKKGKHPIVDIFFHTNTASKSKDKTSPGMNTKRRSMSKIHIKSYK